MNKIDLIIYIHLLLKRNQANWNNLYVTKYKHQWHTVLEAMSLKINYGRCKNPIYPRAHKIITWYKKIDDANSETYRYEKVKLVMWICRKLGLLIRADLIILSNFMIKIKEGDIYHKTTDSLNSDFIKSL